MHKREDMSRRREDMVEGRRERARVLDQLWTSLDLNLTTPPAESLDRNR